MLKWSTLKFPKERQTVRSLFFSRICLLAGAPNLELGTSNSDTLLNSTHIQHDNLNWNSLNLNFPLGSKRESIVLSRELVHADNEQFPSECTRPTWLTRCERRSKPVRLSSGVVKTNRRHSPDRSIQDEAGTENRQFIFRVATSLQINNLKWLEIVI